MTEIHWKPPWHVLSSSEASGFQDELEREVGPLHPLWNRNAVVLGHRQDCDDIVVRLNDGSLVVVHLVWHGKIDQFPHQYPSIQFRGSVKEFRSLIEEDAPPFADD